MHAAGDRRGALGGGGRGGPSMDARGAGWVGYFVEVFWGFRKEDLGCGVEDRKRRKNNARQCQGEGRKKEERRGERDTKKGLIGTKGGEARRRR